MSNIVGSIKQIAKERGVKLSYITSLLGLHHSYFSDVERGKTKISNERLEIIADCLNTTTDYLLGKTDIKNKPSTGGEDDRELTNDEERLILLFRDLSPEQQEIVLRAAGLNLTEPNKD